MRFFKKRNKDPFRIIYRSNTIQFDEMGYPLRLCIVTGNGRDKPEKVWLDTLEEEGDVVLEYIRRWRVNRNETMVCI